MIHLVALQGSVRPQNNTAKALALIAEAAATYPDVSLEIVDPTHLDLGLPGEGTTDDAKRIQALVKQADGILLATPEYHGSYSSVMKLLIDNLGFPSALAGKPIALLGVAAGRIGAIKALEHLRSVASHVGGLVLPGPVSIARVRNVFDAEGRVLDEQAAMLIRDLVPSLVKYIRRHTCPQMALENIVRKAISVS